VINWNLLKHPLNWFIVILMLIIAGFVVDIVVLKFSPASGPATNGVDTSGNAYP
jgi:uncharacterized membrane protein